MLREAKGGRAAPAQHLSQGPRRQERARLQSLLAVEGQ